MDEDSESLAIDKCCRCRKSESDVRSTQNAATSAVPNLQDATTSTCGLAELQQIQKSRYEPQMKPPHFTTFYNLDELMNILFCETEETEKLFTLQVKEMLRRDVVLMEQKEKVNELSIFSQSTAAAMQKCEGNLLYIHHAQNLMEHCLFSLLELYPRDTGVLPGDERASFYNQMLSANLLKVETMIALEDLTEISAGQSGDDDNTRQLNILGILNCHYQVLCTAQLKLDAIKKSIEKIKKDYKSFMDECPYALYWIPDKWP